MMSQLQIIALLCFLPCAIFAGGNRIIGGSDARKGGFPWMVELVYNYRHKCGGSLIADGSLVLTARHCIENKDVANLSLVAGEYIRSEAEGVEQYLDVDRVIFAPDDIDVALLHLTHKPVFNRYVSPIELSPDKASVGNPIMVSGWGMTLHEDFDSMPDTLQQIMMPVVDADTCDPQFVNNSFPWNATHEHEICAGFAGESYINVCHGDSGSPAVSRSHWKQPFRQVGVVSWGTSGCPEDAEYAVFASVHSVYDWIQKQIEDIRGNDASDKDGIFLGLI